MAENHRIQYTLDATDNASDDINRVASAIGNTDNKVKTTSDNMGNFRREIEGVIASWGLFQVAGKVQEFMDLGREVRNTTATFNELNGGSAEAQRTLDMMKDATGGVVDNMTLMQGANRLLLMGLAANGDEAARLTNIAITLGQAMGNDAAGSVQDFAALLANQSIPRLDNFGISSDRVRKRLQELKDAGMGAQEAFTMATLEEGAIAVGKIGTAADVARGPLERLKTTVQNIAETMASRAWTGFEGLVGIVEIAVGANPQQQQRQADIEQYASANATVYADAFNQAVQEALAASAGESRFPLGDKDFTDSVLKDAFAKLKENPSMSIAEIVGSVVDWNATDLVDPEDAQRVSALLYDQLSNAVEAEGVARAQQERQSLVDKLFAAGEAGSQIQNIIAVGFQPSREFLETKRAIQEADGSLAQFMGTYSELYGMPPLSDYMSASDAEAYARQLEAAQSDLDRLKEFADQKLISDDEVKNAEALVDNLKDMSDQADKAAEAFANLKLSDIFGQTGGGMAGEITDMIIQQMQDMGAAAEQIAAMKEALDLSSGRQTASSALFQGQYIPQLAGMSPDEAAAQIANLQAYFQQMALQGASQTQITAGLPFAGQYGSVWGEYDQKMLDMYGGTTGAGAMGDDVQAAADSSIELKDNMGEVETHALGLQDVMTTLTSTVHIIKAELQVNGLDKLLAALGSAGGNPQVPGDPRVGGRTGSVGNAPTRGGGPS